MARMGSIEAEIALAGPLDSIPPALASFPLTLSDDHRTLTYRGHGGADDARGEVARLVETLVRSNIAIASLDTRQSSLEDIFVDLVEHAESKGARA